MLLRNINSTFIKSLYFIIFIPLIAFSQNSERINYTTYFDSILGISDQLIYNGVQFEDLYRSNQENFRYLEIPQYHIGNIQYDGQDYYNINMKYDLVDDQVIIMSTGKFNFFDVQLIQEKVQNFDFRNRHFVFYNANETLEKGFYEEAYKDENVVFLVKHTKIPKKRNGNKFSYYIFNYKESYFIKANDILTEISTLKDVKKLFNKDTVILQSYPKFNAQNKNDTFKLYLVRLLKYLKRNQ
ncbi:hypothetical protein [Autumnicola musiva]|uniref:Uncharacterized protein n=1 Tax=Autumnicola musiva TaxID=3075589 RepID=A0ABU3DB29_9FLAO|nr:hypothetical protein [Zunongwangia sp. F117]MDT0678714.1 hypothetical protein [Zunongwangia sp. F117]